VDLEPRQIVELAAQRGVPLDLARAEARRASAESLLRRLSRFVVLLPRETGPPPTSARR
jgi:hypothetical protein